MKYILIIGIVLISLIFCLNLYSEESKMLSYPIVCKELPIKIVGISVIPHTYSKEIRYSRAVSEELGSLVRLFVMHSKPSGEPMEMQLTFNGKKPSELVASGDWAWFEMPENLSEEGKPYLLNPGKMDVFTFNAKKWHVGSEFSLNILEVKSGLNESVNIPIRQTDVIINLISCFTGENGSIYPDKMLVHLENNAEKPYKTKQIRIFASTPTGMTEQKTVKEFETFTENKNLPAKDRSGIMFHTGKLPLTYGVLELQIEDESEKESSVWVYLKFKVDQFDIGSGWLEIQSRPGIIPVTKESYLKLLKRMHVNLTHLENISGYTDSLGEDGLYTRYPMRLMSGFGDIDRYNTDEWMAKIHGVDAVGEPQLGLTPMATYDALKKYKRAKYPTTLTLSDDSGFRYYAGLADFPHFDAYRVTAPSADTWWLYDRWDKKLLWGAPLEGIGEMTRTLRAISRPLPIALWSQSIHDGGEGELHRKRKVPNPDEILMQAYQGLANGVMGLYWYSLQSWSVLKYRDTLDITTRIGREMRLLDSFYLTGDAYKHERIDVESKPNLDLNSIITPDSALLFALDLDYEPDRKAQVFRFKGIRNIDVSFQLPGYLKGIKDLFKVSADGIINVGWESMPNGVKIKDQLDKVGIYVATKDAGMRQKLTKRLEDLITLEKSVGFDPANDSDFSVLMKDLGFERIDDVGPEPRPKRPISESDTMSNPVYLGLEPAVQKEIMLTQDQIDSIYEIAEDYQLDIYSEMANDFSESFDQSQGEWQRIMELAQKLLPKYQDRLRAILQPEQVKRLEQITLQASGISAFKNEMVIKALEITKEQQEKLSAIEASYNQKRRELRQEDVSQEERRSKTGELNKKQNEEMMQILSEDQKRKLEEIKGSEFEM